MKLEEFLENVVENTVLDNYHVSKNGDSSYVIELEYWSGLDEDCIIPLVVEELTITEVIKEMRRYEDYFDAEEHATELFNLHGAGGTPTSMRALLEDADEQAKNISDILDIMYDIYFNKGGI